MEDTDRAAYAPGIDHSYTPGGGDWDEQRQRAAWFLLQINPAYRHRRYGDEYSYTPDDTNVDDAEE